MRKLEVALVILISFLALACSDNEINCVIQGEIIGRNSDTLILIKALEDPLFAEIYIPIKEGKFEYTLTVPYTEAYALIFKDEMEMGRWRPVFFFPETGTTEFKLHSMQDHENNEISGGILTSEYYNYQKLFEREFIPQYNVIQDSIEVLINNNEYYSEEFQELQTEVLNAKDNETRVHLTQKLQGMVDKGDFVTPKGKLFNEKREYINEKVKEWRYKYIADTPSLISFYFLVQDIQISDYNKTIEIEEIKEYISRFYYKYPDHPYSELAQTMLSAKDLIQVGNKYIDFFLPDLEGEIQKLSEVIDGKYAVIDFWASWCGPCIMGSRELMPIYEEFKDKGFTICGIAREYRNTDRMVQRIEMENYPWTNLVELDDKNQIWLKYDIQGGGKKFLVDNKGVILAIEPKADEVREILSERLSE